MSYNKITVIGNLGRDPELRYTTDGKGVCTFSVATTDKYKGRDGNSVENTIWFKVSAWGKLGENVSKYLSKGKQVYIEGRLGKEEWTDNTGKARTELTIFASEVQFLSPATENGRPSTGGRDYEHDQRRRGPDENERSQVQGADALPLTDKDIPF
jgi:single-strand DNA-binding protein